MSSNAEINILSHRGGQTDYDKAQNDVFTHNRHAENTIEAIKFALKEGADGVEIDIIRTKDNKLVVIHSVDLADHVFNRNNEKLGFVGDYTMQELQDNFKVGPKSDGIIPELTEVTDLIASQQKKTGRDIILNIEIKDVKGTKIPKSAETDIKEILAKHIKAGPLGSKTIIISSFSIKDIQAVEKLNLGVKLGFLFDVSSKSKKQIYVNDSDDQYTIFTPDNIKEVHSKVKSLSFAHPSIDDVNHITAEVIKQEGLGLSTWSSSEDHPGKDKGFSDNLINLVKEYNIPTNIITNFVPEMRRRVEVCSS